MLAGLLLQHACPSPLQRHGSLPSGQIALHSALPKPNTDQQGLASVMAQGERASAAHEHALDSTAAVSVATAAMSDGWLAAAARVLLATVASQQLAGQAATEPSMAPCRGLTPISKA